MLFNSYLFIFLFLPMTLLVYYMLNHIKRYQLAKGWLTLASFFFYGYNNYSYLLIILSSIFINYGCYLIMDRKPVIKRWVLTAGIVFNLGLLGYFKYFDFLLTNVNLFLHTDFNLLQLMLPLGISFFTFQQLSFLIDSYRGTSRCDNFLDYALFVTFFPQLVAGPIVSHEEIIPQFASQDNKRLNSESMAKGIQMFAIGLFKKVIVADSFGRIANYGYSFTGNLNSAEAFFTVIAYTIQIYYDFSGYCDMAAGIAQMFNIVLPINFNSPYKALTIVDFWKRWHMTLTRFLTRYVYIPLGGSHKGISRTYINIFIVFLVSGIWHGAGYTFILWGILHGIANILCRCCSKWIDRIPKWINWGITFLFINITWVLFRANSISQALLLFKQLFSGGFSIGIELRNIITQVALVDLPYQFLPLTVVLLVYSVIATAVAVFADNTQTIVPEHSSSRGMLIACIFMFLLSILSLSGVSTFLYFNF